MNINEQARILYSPASHDGSTSAASFASPARSDHHGEKDPNKNVTLVNHSLLPVLSVPTQDLHSRGTKLFQCSMVAERNKYIMYHQKPDGSEIAVLRADKQKTIRSLPKYHIYDISKMEGGDVVPLEKTATEYLGKIRREKDLRTHSFALHSEREEGLSRKVMHVLHNIPTFTLFGKEPPRKVQVALYSESSDSSDQGNTLSDRVSSSLRETGFLDKATDPKFGIHTYANKEPYKNQNGEYALSFTNNRCRISNPGNAQMEDAQGAVVLQVAQLDDNKFSIDFRAPFTSFTAFAFAVAQFVEY